MNSIVPGTILPLKEVLEHQRNLLDLEIRRLEMQERIKGAKTIVIYMRDLDGQLNKLHISNQDKTDKLRAFLLELL